MEIAGINFIGPIFAVLALVAIFVFVRWLQRNDPQGEEWEQVSPKGWEPYYVRAPHDPPRLRTALRYAWGFAVLAAWVVIAALCLSENAARY